MRVYRWFIKEKIERRLGLFVDIFVSKKKKHVHFAFKKALSSYSCLVSFVRKEWEKRHTFRTVRNVLPEAGSFYELAF